MKYFFSVVIVSLFLVSCGSAQKSDTKNKEESSASVVEQENSNERSGWIKVKSSADSTKKEVAKEKIGKLQVKEEKTPEQKKRDSELQQARKAFRKGVENYNKKHYSLIRRMIWHTIILERFIMKQIKKILLSIIIKKPFFTIPMIPTLSWLWV